MDALQAIPGYDGLYSVTRDGRVFSHAKPRRKGHWDPKEFFLKPRYTRNGYQYVTLVRPGLTRNMFVHRIVCLAFHGPAPADQPIVNHKDAQKANNHADNLEWCSYSENMVHAMKTVPWIRNSPKGEASPLAKIKEADVIEIRRLRAAGMRATEIAELYPINNRMVSAICLRRAWKHVA